MKQYNYLLIFFIIIVASCAQIVAPNGGDKDEIAPVIVGETPTNKTTNFNADKITIKFDEFITLNNADQITISPIVESKPDIDFNGKELTVKFKETLTPNKTYTINFANSIADIHEGTTVNNYVYVFATGNILDSNSVNGNVKNAFNLRPENSYTVALYPKATFTDSTLETITPSYFSKTNKDGKFSIENLPSDSFYIFVFNDENKNFKHNNTEKIGFYNSAISTENKSDINLFTYLPNLYAPNHIKDTFVSYKGVYQFAVYNANNLLIKPTNNTKFFTKTIIGSNKIDTISLYVPSFIEPNNPEEFTVSIDSISQNFALKTKRTVNYPPFKLTTNTEIKLNDTLVIKLTNPIENFTKKSIVLKQDTLIIEPKFLKLVNPFEIKIFNNWKENTSYSLNIADSTLFDAFAQPNKKYNQSFTTKSEKDYGTLILNITNTQNLPLIVQLVEDSEDENVVDEFTINKTTTKNFKYLNPGSVKIKLIIDQNNNLKWDNGNLINQPERVVYHTESLTIRAYWDMEQTINADKLLSN